MDNVYEIKKAAVGNFPLIKSFLLDVPAIEEVDDAILKNASILYLDNKVSGVISYETFYNYALIRYFVFKRNVDEMIIKELFQSVEDSICDDDIEFVFSLVNQDDIYSLFSSLNFSEVKKEDVFIEEQNFEKSKFKDTKLMIKRLEV